MKKFTLILFCLVAIFTISQAQAQTPVKNKYLNVGIGLAAYTAGGVPIGASLEVDYKNNISIGGFFDYARYGYRYSGYKWNYNFLYFGARGSYHLGELLKDLDIDDSKFDPYAGISLGIRTSWYNDNTDYDNFKSPYNGGIFLGVHVGSRYMFSEKLGGFAEVGYGVSALRLGVTAKF
ncbi:outer membrane beta-barrel protein [Adhaeribacter radiodurans]|uniref:Outer membrane beta-barrel protein n=1 Tax=Adhaeribacter radiodurans TaxID=2745197 RepID=A0A7L7L4M8_9BACT|nr:outer membrane beta-barrel protein [Adhaeribacter radiodurans]QMU27771.1 hypothetical protein HUW48_06805 [Adhaeribacter radiodurans]